MKADAAVSRDGRGAPQGGDGAASANGVGSLAGGGCSCGLGGRPDGSPWAALLLAAIAVTLRRRRGG